MIVTREQKKMYKEKAEIIKALAHPVRLCIVKNLVDIGGCNVTKMQACLEMPQSTVSQHLGKLKSSGIIEGERHGTEIIYKVTNQDAINIVNNLIIFS